VWSSCLRRGKTTELEKKRDQKGMDEKIARNEQKLQHTRQIYLALTAEARTRMREMSAERFDFFGGPFTQLVAAERAFFGGVTQALEPLGETTSEDALRRAGMTMSARPSRSRPPLTLEMILAGEGQVDAGGGGSGGNWEQDDRYSTNPPVQRPRDAGLARRFAIRRATPCALAHAPAHRRARARDRAGADGHDGRLEPEPSGLYRLAARRCAGRLPAAVVWRADGAAGRTGRL
jgi:hypothetical protein